MGKQRRSKPDREERRENALRPCKYLGYNQDELGLYFLDRGAFNIAESQFRRAIWLNPFELEFKMHLAGCLLKQQRFQQARDEIIQVLQARPEYPSGKHLLEIIERRAVERPEPQKPRNNPQ